MSARFRPMLLEVSRWGASSAKFDKMWHDFGQIRPESAKFEAKLTSFGLTLAKSGRTRAKSGQPRLKVHRAKFNRLRANLAKICGCGAKAGCNRAQVGQIRSKFARVRPNLAKVGRTRAKVGRSRPKSVQFRSKFGRPTDGRHLTIMQILETPLAHGPINAVPTDAGGPGEAG